MLLNFVDRGSELSGLNDQYRKESAGLFILYGRRRIGKTTLVKKFAESKPSFYFLAKRQDLSLELERLRESFSEKFDIFIEKSEDLDRFFKNVIDRIEFEDKFVFIIDEFPYWIEENKSILSEMQHLWDERLKDENIFLILTGSSIGMMETEVLNYKSPIYGRRTGQLKLNEMPISALENFLPSYSYEDLIRTYGALGAVPFYLKEFDKEKGFFKNIQTTFFNNLNILYEEAEILLREELRKPNVYFNMIKAIIDGATKLGEISSESHVSVTNVNKYLNVLERLEIIEREYPVTESAKKKNFHYRVTDNYFRFWLSFVYPDQGRIEGNSENIVKKVKKDYAHFMGPVFEEICKMYVKKNHDYDKVGKWWYKENEIDVVGLNEEKDKMLLGECKWNEKTVGQGLYHKLKEKEEKVRWKNDDRQVEYILFSRSGFDEDMYSLAEDNLSLVDLEDLWYGFEH